MRAIRALAGLVAGVAAAALPASRVGSGEREPTVTVLERTSDPLLRADQPWEDFSLSYCQVLRIGGAWQLWYNARDHHYRGAADGFVCYARSKDGVRWEKPALGLVAYAGERRNNILAVGCNLGSVFVDEAAPAAERFKAVVTRPSGDHSGVFGGTSADGIHWVWGDEPLLKCSSDTANVCFRDGGRYRLYSRLWTEPPYGGRRMIGYSESARFGAFPDPAVILQADPQDAGDVHFYSSAATKLGPQRYLMLPSVFTTGDGLVRLHAAFSRDGRQFQRVGRCPVVAPGPGFDRAGLYASPGAVPEGRPNTWWYYYLGLATPHDQSQPGKVVSDGGIGRFLVRVVD